MSNLAHVLECVVSSASPTTAHPEIPKLRVLLDGRKIEGGGIGVYIKNLISGLSSLPFIDLTVLVHPGKTEVAARCGATKTIEDKAKLYSIDELLFLKRRIPFKDFDVFHVPHYTLPYRVPIPTVVTIHDTIHISHGERFYYPMIAKRLIKSSLRRATKVVTVSESTRRSLESLSPTRGGKISVVPNAVDPIFLIETCLGEGAVDERPRSDYIMSVFSNIKPHKGLNDLVDAFLQVKNQVKELAENDPLREQLEKTKLVLTGLGTEALKGKELGEDILVSGAVSAQELQRLYSQCQCLVVSSLIEGFCLPVIEAQACATPVVARPAPAVLELMTTNDFVCKDMSVQGLVEGILDFFRKKSTRPDLIEYGVPLSHMRRFCREDVSRSVVEVYQDAVSHRRL